MFLIACTNDTIPKPRGYFRIDFPEKKYSSYTQTECGYTFELPSYSMINTDKSTDTEHCWLNIDFPMQRATIHMSYKNITNNLSQYTEDSRALAYKHTAKAEAIDEEYIHYPDKKVFGLIYHIQGNAASSLQFYLTDSVKSFVRGALYFNAVPNKDSMAPVSDFINVDISHIIETFHW
jgi:gliding motility-associated lipoprotein GldD